MANSTSLHPASPASRSQTPSSEWPTVEPPPEFDWRKLTALGLSLEDAETIAQTLALKKMMLAYWRRLLRVGIPPDDARRIARAIAKYDAMKVFSTHRQQELIAQYCARVCRAGLWRADLLLFSRQAASAFPSGSEFPSGSNFPSGSKMRKHSAKNHLAPG